MYLRGKLCMQRETGMLCKVMRKMVYERADRSRQEWAGGSDEYIIERFIPYLLLWQYLVSDTDRAQPSGVSPVSMHTDSKNMYDIRDESLKTCQEHLQVIYNPKITVIFHFKKQTVFLGPLWTFNIEMWGIKHGPPSNKSLNYCRIHSF